MEIIDKVTKEDKDYEYISSGTLLKDQQETVWLVTDEHESQNDRIIVDVETGETDYWEDEELTKGVNNGTLLIISKSELTILAYE